MCPERMESATAVAFAQVRVFNGLCVIIGPGLIWFNLCLCWYMLVYVVDIELLCMCDYQIL